VVRVTVYAINKVCFLSERDATFREQLRTQPETTLAAFPKLDAEERQAVLAGDVVALFRKGAHPFLLQHLAQHRLFGLNRDIYRERITTER
jgi:Aromatic-ring-opening dioxygenase LigAB, LigA subunit